MDTRLTFDEALLIECEHGIPKVIICPKCDPEKYVLTPQQLEKLRPMIEEGERELAAYLAARKEERDTKS